MNIRYFIISENEEAIDTATATSIEKNRLPEEKVENNVAGVALELAINKAIETNYDQYKTDGVTHICIVPNGAVFTDAFKDVVRQAVVDDKTLYLPIVQYFEFDAEKKNKNFRGLLNTCMWKPYGANEYGKISEGLAIKQIDTTLYGALIPLDVIKEYPFKTKIKYYAFFEYISRLAHKHVSIQGISKVVMQQVGSDALKSASQEDKVKFFKACQTEYLNDEDNEIADASVQAPPAVQPAS